MIAGMAPREQARPRRGRPLLPASTPRSRELLAGAAVTVLLVHLVLAPLALVLAVACTAVSRISRWRLWWLLAPAVAGLAWALAAGPHQALAGFVAGPSTLLRHFTAVPAAVPAGPLAGVGGWLPRQFPLALPLAAAEAAVAGWLRWRRTDEWSLPPPRPGVVAALCGAASARALRGGVARLSWTELGGGVLVTAEAGHAVVLACLQVVHAALRCRKPVIVLDVGQQPGLAAALATACRATGTPLLTAGARPGIALSQVVSERLAVLLPAGSAELAAGACAALGALARDLRRIGVDGDALVWVPMAERLGAPALAALVRDGAATGLAVLMGTASPATAAELAGAAGTLLIGPVADPDLAAALAPHTGTRLLPSATAADSGQRQEDWPPVGTIPTAPPAGDRPAAAAASALVPSPAVPAAALMALGPAEFVLAVRTPRPRLVAPGRLVPARLPRLAPAAGPVRGVHPAVAP
jgi:hypothetical protein